MPDDLIATGVEADTGVQRIERAVERVTQGDGDTHRQDAGGLVAFGTSLGHDRPPRTVDSAKTEVKWEHSTEDFIQKTFFVNRKIGGLSHLFGLSQQSPTKSPRRIISRVC